MKIQVDNEDLRIKIVLKAHPKTKPLTFIYKVNKFH